MMQRISFADSLSLQDGSKFYGSSVTFYEPYTKPLTNEQMDKLEVANEAVSRGTVEDASNINDPAEQVSLWYEIAAIYIQNHSLSRAGLTSS